MRTLRVIVIAALAATVTGCASLPDTGAGTNATTAFAGCKAYDSQPAAQRAWERAGSPKKNDRDGDGVICTSLRSSSKASDSKSSGNNSDNASCRKATKTVTVDLPRNKYPETAYHIEVAQKNGQPKVLHWDPTNADAARSKWQPLVKTRPGKDRDEWPMASTREGMNGTSHVAYIDPSDNRGAGSTIAGDMHEYCNGTPFRVRITGVAPPKPVTIVVGANNGKSENTKMTGTAQASK